MTDHAALTASVLALLIGAVVFYSRMPKKVLPYLLSIESSDAPEVPGSGKVGKACTQSGDTLTQTLCYL
jgi:hypothetical protein